MSPSQQQWPRGPRNDLHRAAHRGSTEATIALLSRGDINIDQGDPDGITPLMYSVQENYSRVARILLNKGANVSIVEDSGCSALHLSAYYGHLAVTLDLVKAGADLEAQSVPHGSTPLHLAAIEGHSGVTAALVAAGANVDSRSRDGETPLLLAAQQGHLSAAKELLRAGANALLAATTSPRLKVLPLDQSAQNRHSCVVRELIKQRGIKGCGGASGGVDALVIAAQHQHVDIMVILMNAGVIDTGEALVSAAAMSREAAVKLLLQRRRLEGCPTGVGDYVNFCDHIGCTPLFHSIDFCKDANGDVLQLISPRVVQYLVDAGADTTKSLQVTNTAGGVNNGTPLAFTIQRLREKKAGGKDLTNEQLQRLEAVRRLLLRVEAVHAVSWLWHTDAPVAQLVGHGGTGKAMKASSPLRMVLPILRRRARTPGLVMAPLFRHSMKIGLEPASDEGDLLQRVWNMGQQCTHM